MGGAHLPVAFQFAGGGGIVLGQRQHALESRGSGARRLRIGIVGIQGSLTVLEITCEGGLVGLLPITELKAVSIPDLGKCLEIIEDYLLKEE